MIEGSLVYLRALEPEDVDLLYDWENDTDTWQAGYTTKPISISDIRAFVEHSDLDIYQTHGTRLMIALRDTRATVGCIDLFDFDPFHMHGNIGILINKNYRECGYGKDAIATFAKYLFDYLGLNSLCATVSATNLASVKLFAHSGFELCGRRPKWLRHGSEYVDELIYTLTKR